MNVREALWTSGNCNCHRDYSATYHDHHHHILTIPATCARAETNAEVTLFHLLEELGVRETSIVVDRPPCQTCGSFVDNCKSISIIGAKPLVLIALNRIDVARPNFARPPGWIEGVGRTDRDSRPSDRTFHASKHRVRETPNLQLQLGDTYHLRSVVVHKGSTPQSGHYICYVRRGIDSSTK